jgi:hypothetical protein
LKSVFLPQLNAVQTPFSILVRRIVNIVPMPTDHIITLLIAERDKLNAAIEALQDGGGISSDGTPKKPATMASEPTSAAPEKRHVSAAAKRKMAAAQKKRWAAIKAAKKA